MSTHATWALSMLLPVILAALFSVFYYTRFSTIPKEKALALWASTLLLTFGWFFFFMRRGNRHLHSPEDALSVIAAMLCVIVAVPFVVRLWSKWVQANLTEEERTPGAMGWRAWFRGGNVIAALLIAVLAWYGFHLSLPLMFLATFGALAVYPAILAASSDSASAEPPPFPTGDNLASEREKVLSMLEAGKISAEESAELLTALGATVRHAEAPRPAASAAQRLVLVGAAVLLIGFMLPWLVINPGKELNQIMGTTTNLNYMMGDFTSSVHGLVGRSNRDFGLPDVGTMVNQATTLPANLEFQIAGGSIGKGLGWAALLLGIFAAILPYIANAMDIPTQRLVRFLALGGGATIILYVLTSAPRSIGIGLVVAALGIALEFIGVARERRAV